MLSATFALHINSEKWFFHYITFDKHIVTTDVTVALGLVSQSFLSDAAQAGTEYLSINLKQHIPRCSVT